MATLLGISVTGEDLELVRYLQPPDMRQRIFGAVPGLIEGLASSKQMVLVFEDLHWADGTSLDLVEELMALTDSTMLLIIGLFRPQRHEPSWRFHEVATRDFDHRYTSLTLDTLDEAASRSLITTLLPGEGIPEDVRTMIRTKSEGNPFFVEELIRSLLDSGIVARNGNGMRLTGDMGEIAVPHTLAGVLTTRLDQLDPESKAVAQTASVIGREFRSDMLAALTDQPATLQRSLNELQRRGLIRELSRKPQHVYAFRQSLAHQTAYSSLLMSSRRDIHRRAAEWLESADGDQLSEITRHLLAARENARALPYLVEAGDRAARPYATPEAKEYFSKAIEIVEAVDDVDLARRAYEGLGSALQFANDATGAVDVYWEMAEFAKAHGDIPMQVSAVNKSAFVHGVRLGELEKAEKQLAESERLASSCDDASGLAELNMTECYLRTPVGDFEGAMDHLRKAAKIGDEIDHEEAKLFGNVHIANTLIYMTRFDEAGETAQKALQLARDAGHRAYQAELLSWPIAFNHLREGKMESALNSSAEGLELATQIGATTVEALAGVTHGMASRLTGNFEAAIDSCERAIDASRRSGLPYLEAALTCSLGAAYLEISEDFAERTAALHAEALAMADQPLGMVMGGMIWAEIGLCDLATGDADRAQELFRKGLTISTALKLLVRPHLLMGSALIALGQGDLEEAARLIGEAREFADETGMRFVCPFIDMTNGMIAGARGSVDDALQFFTKAEEDAVEMEMRPAVLQMRAASAQILSGAGRNEEAKAKRAAAQITIDDIAGSFSDAELREIFVTEATKKLGGVAVG